MIKVFVSEDPAEEPIPSVFTFTHPTTARADCDAIQDLIKQATAERAKPKTVADILKDGEEGLLKNTEVQMSLLKADVELSKMFRNLVIDGPLSAEQFWRARVHLLRAHAIERTQQRGPYNVLAVLKPKTQDGTTKVSLSAERIRDIFEQHPLIKRVYDENVPRLSEDEFWARFFMSRLKKKLSGEKISEKDPVDDIMDKYLRPDYDQINQKRRREEETPNFINLEGNEEHISKGGNQPDRTMRASEDVPIMHTINSLSRRMVDSVTQGPSTTSASKDDEYMAALRLTDLQPDRPDVHVSLNITNPESMDFGWARSSQTPRPTINPLEALKRVQQNLQTERVDLLSVGKNPDALSLAANHITTEIKSQAHALTVESTTTQLGLTDSVLSQVHLTHSASVEFLRQFWITYLSTSTRSSARKKELAALVASLKRAVERMEAVRAFAVKEDGEGAGETVRGILLSVKASIDKAVALWERGESG